MHIFRWLMTHPIITAWILAALAILLNLNTGGTKHAESSHANSVAHEEVVESGTMPASASLSGAERQSVQIQHGSEDKKSVEADQDNNSSASERGAANPDMSNGASNGIVTQVTGNSLDAATPIVQQGSGSNSQSTEGSTMVTNNPEGDQQGLTSMSTESLLQLARESFWQNNKEKSVAIYQALIKREPDSLAYKGELANVYWHQNKQKQSAAIYAEIAAPMIEAGKKNEVSNMLGFISVFFPEKSLELQKLMSK